ncbi:MAG: hypothetical protein HC876_16815 [Chloroflexaceae bacterium]|nr:hypothetical protein [Chloroflexaceae bacterium]
MTGRTFRLDAYNGATTATAPLDGFAFAQPISIIVEYDPIYTANLAERPLWLYRRADEHWQHIGRSYTYDPANSRVTIQTTATGEFVLVQGPLQQVHLPRVVGR